MSSTKTSHYIKKKFKKKRQRKEINVKENSFCNAGELKNPTILNYFLKFHVEQINFVKMDFLLL